MLSAEITERDGAEVAGHGSAAVAIARPGLVPYREALALQEQLLADRVAGRIRDTLLLLEHPPVVTLGRSGGAEFLHHSGALEHPAVGPIERFETDRGGKVTYHGPGQLVGYGIVNLPERGLYPASWAHLLEDTLVEVLAGLGLDGERIPDRVGVWLGARKIASIGVRVRQGVAMHGFALNVTTDLAPFTLMDPCGLDGVQMTSTRAEGSSASFDEVLERTAQVWQRRVETARRSRP